MAARLTDDPDYQATTFVVIDFETTTPKGHRPEPLEVAALALRADAAGALVETARFEELIRPPAHAPVTRFDTEQCGIRPQDVTGARTAPAVLADLAAWLPPTGILLVAHNAHVEAGLIYDYREHCPQLAGTHLLDTVKLARAVLPDLVSYGLDHVMIQLKVPRPANRHRAMPDVEATATVFGKLLDHATRDGRWSTLTEFTKAVGLVARATRPQQDLLF